MRVKPLSLHLRVKPLSLPVRVKPLSLHFCLHIESQTFEFTRESQTFVLRKVTHQKKKMQNNNTNVWSNTTTTKAKHTWKTSANTEQTKQQVKHILATEEFQTKLQSLTRTNSQTRAATKTEILVRLREELGYAQQAQAVKDYQNNQTNRLRESNL